MNGAFGHFQKVALGSSSQVASGGDTDGNVDIKGKHVDIYLTLALAWFRVCCIATTILGDFTAVFLKLDSVASILEYPII